MRSLHGQHVLDCLDMYDGNGMEMVAHMEMETDGPYGLPYMCKALKFHLDNYKFMAR